MRNLAGTMSKVSTQLGQDFFWPFGKDNCVKGRSFVELWRVVTKLS